MQSVEVLRHKTQTAILLSCKHCVLMVFFNKPVRDHQTRKNPSFLLIDLLIVLGFNDTSTLVSHFMSSPDKGKKEMEGIVMEMKEGDREER